VDGQRVYWLYLTRVVIEMLMHKVTLKNIILFSIICLLFLKTGWAAEASVAKLKSFLESTRSMSANFSQVVIDEKGMTGQENAGLFLLQRPGKFRWEYQTPYQQTIVSNGKKVWFYDVDLEQVTIKNLNGSIGSTPALLLSGQIDIDQNYLLEDLGDRDGLAWVKLVPKAEESTFKYILIGLGYQGLNTMELNDNFGQLTRIYFSGVKINAAIDSKAFSLEPPPGVDIFEEG